jgi:hypothetical protein
MIIYISGPVTGIRNNNRRNFEKARKKLEDAFFDSRIISPLQIALMVELDQKHTKPEWADYMRGDFGAADCGGAGHSLRRKHRGFENNYQWRKQ